MNTSNADSTTRLFVDKVGLQFPSHFLFGSAYQRFRFGDLTIMRWGETSRIMLHDELIRKHGTPALAIIEAMTRLTQAAVFDIIPTYFVCAALRDFASGEWGVDAILARILAFFEFRELELTVDLPGVVWPGHVNDQMTQLKGTTFYTRDYKAKVRGENSKRAGESKGRQKSFVCIYRKDTQGGDQDPFTRIEFRFDGKYRADLKPYQVFLKPWDLLKDLAPGIKEKLKNTGAIGAVDWNPAALLAPGSTLPDFLETIGWQEEVV